MHPRRIGAIYETDFVKQINAIDGLSAKRNGGSWDKGIDAMVRYALANQSVELPVQCKKRKDRFPDLYDWLGEGSPVLATRDDYKPTLITMHLQDWACLLLGRPVTAYSSSVVRLSDFKVG